MCYCLWTCWQKQLLGEKHHPEEFAWYYTNDVIEWTCWNLEIKMKSSRDKGHMETKTHSAANRWSDDGLRTQQNSIKHRTTSKHGPSSRSSYRACSCEFPTNVRRPLSWSAWRCHARGRPIVCSLDNIQSSAATATGTPRDTCRHGAASALTFRCMETFLLQTYDKCVIKNTVYIKNVSNKLIISYKLSIHRIHWRQAWVGTGTGYRHIKPTISNTHKPFRFQFWL